MREVDEALARAYAHKEKGDLPQGVPPRPHWTNPVGPRPAAPMPTSEEVPTPAAVLTATEPGDPVELQWPALVLTLEHQWGERFGRLADHLIEARRRQHLRVLLFTSCHRAEGRTTLVLTLARALAHHPGRTILVDADLTGPMLARLLGLRPRIGLDDVVERGQALADAVIDAPEDHLAILPLRAAVARPRDFLDTPAWACAVARLRRDYDLILLDGGPLFTGLSAAVLHRSVDAAVLVCHRGLTSSRALLRAREVLESGGVPLLGLAETFV
jgi:Mrp family chromosome partitioning ATPase